MWAWIILIILLCRWRWSCWPCTRRRGEAGHAHPGRSLTGRFRYKRGQGKSCMKFYISELQQRRIETGDWICSYVSQFQLHAGKLVQEPRSLKKGLSWETNKDPIEGKSHDVREGSIGSFCKGAENEGRILAFRRRIQIMREGFRQFMEGYR